MCKLLWKGVWQMSEKTVSQMSNKNIINALGDLLVLISEIKDDESRWKAVKILYFINSELGKLEKW